MFIYESFSSKDTASEFAYEKSMYSNVKHVVQFLTRILVLLGGEPIILDLLIPGNFLFCSTKRIYLSTLINFHPSIIFLYVQIVHRNNTLPGKRNGFWILIFKRWWTYFVTSLHSYGNITVLDWRTPRIVENEQLLCFSLAWRGISVYFFMNWDLWILI